MARARSGVSGYAVGLVIFVILFVITLLLSIVFYTQLNGSRTAEQSAKGKLATFVRPNEQTIPEVAARVQEVRNAGSVVRQLLDENAELKALTTGDGQATIDTIKNQMASREMADGQNFIAEIDRQLAELTAAQASIQRLEQDLEEARNSVTAAQEARNQALATFTQAEAELRATFDGLESDFQAYQSEVAQMRQLLERQMADLRGGYEQTLSEQRGEVDRLTQENQDLWRKLRDIIGGGEGSPELEPWRQPDGKILALVPEKNLVYINLGMADHLLLGLTFEVYDDDVGVVADEFGRLRGKATVEVVNIDEHAAVARVVAIERNAIVKEGDIVANVVYDPKETYKFYVFGDFDLDGTGQPRTADRKRVESMIIGWRGVLADELDFDTDFLVLGVPPELPPPLAEGEIDPVKIAQDSAARRVFGTYQTLTVEAKALSIPILNQHRFLSLVGYYKR